MTPEEKERFERIERIVEFLASNQAQITAASQDHDARIAENTKQIAQLTELTLKIGHIVEIQAHRMDELAQRMDGLAHSIDGLTHRMDELAESQRRTDERLNTLINVVERYYSNGKH